MGGEQPAFGVVVTGGARETRQSQGLVWKKRPTRGNTFSHVLVIG
jgi:hypothetical protein